MPKTILITGATDGIGFAAASLLVSQGHHVLVHGRNHAKLDAVVVTLSKLNGEGSLEGYLANLSDMADVVKLAEAVTAKHTALDVLINNAGVYQVPDPVTKDGLDIRFVVNTVAPYLLTQKLMPLLGTSARVINLSSAAQSPVDLSALAGQVRLSDSVAYAQSKLALTMWSRSMALSTTDNGPAIIAVNPGSLLGSKMVKEAYGISGGDIATGAEILVRAALDEEFSTASGQYFDNDKGQFAPPHPDVLDLQQCKEIERAITTLLSNLR